MTSRFPTFAMYGLWWLLLLLFCIFTSAQCHTIQTIDNSTFASTSIQGNLSITDKTQGNPTYLMYRISIRGYYLSDEKPPKTFPKVYLDGTVDEKFPREENHNPSWSKIMHYNYGYLGDREMRIEFRRDKKDQNDESLGDAYFIPAQLLEDGKNYIEEGIWKGDIFRGMARLTKVQ